LFAKNIFIIKQKEIKMKRVTLIIVAVLLLLGSMPADAQFHVGLMGGLNYSNLKAQEDNPFDANPDDFKKLTVSAMGAVLDIELHKYLSLRIEPMYLQKGSSYEEPNDEKVLYKLSYFEMPFFLKVAYPTAVTPYIIAGPTFGFLLSAEAEVEMGEITGVADVKEIAESTDFGFGIGAGVSYDFSKFSVFLEGRYLIGRKNVNKGGQVDMDIGTVIMPMDVDALEIKNKGMQIMFGVTIPLGSKKQ